MEKKYFHKKQIPVPLYTGHLVIIFSNDADKIGKYIPDYNDVDYALSWYDGGINDKVFIVLNFHHPDRMITNGVISHECLHATNFILSDRGVVADFENDEVISYLLDWCVNRVYEFARDKKMKIHYSN